MTENKTPAPAVGSTSESTSNDATVEPQSVATEATTADQPQTEASTPPPKPKVHPNRSAYELLHEHYPELFDLKAAKPLQIGIHVSLAEDGKLSKTKIRRALNYYVQQLAYIRAVAKGGARFGLTGEAGSVSEEDQVHAKARVEDIEARRKAKREERRLAQQKKTGASKKPARGKPNGARKARKPAEKSPQTRTGQNNATRPNNNDETVPSGNKEERMNQKLASLAKRFNNS